MRKIVLTYGSYSGITIAMLLCASVYFTGAMLIHSEVAGYSMMALALVFLIVGMKRYRDEQESDTFRYLEGLLVGAGIAAVASLCYTVAWELLLYLNDYSFMSEYIKREMTAARESDQTLQQLEALEIRLNQQAEWYSNFTFRAGITFMEMFPVGALVSLLAALILKNPDVLPRKAKDVS